MPLLVGYRDGSVNRKTTCREELLFMRNTDYGRNLPDMVDIIFSNGTTMKKHIQTAVQEFGDRAMQDAVKIRITNLEGYHPFMVHAKVGLIRDPGNQTDIAVKIMLERIIERYPQFLEDIQWGSFTGPRAWITSKLRIADIAKIAAGLQPITDSKQGIASWYNAAVLTEKECMRLWLQHVVMPGGYYTIPGGLARKTPLNISWATLKTSNGKGIIPNTVSADIRGSKCVLVIKYLAAMMSLYAGGFNEFV